MRTLPAVIQQVVGMPNNMITGTVAAVNADGTLNVNIRGTVITGMSALNSYIAPHVGDNVEISSFGSTKLVLGMVAPANQNPLPAIQSGIVSVSFTSQTFIVINVQYPIAYDTAPAVYVNIRSGAGPTSRWGARAISVGGTSFQIFLYATDTNGTVAATWSNIPVGWTAIRQ